MAMIKSMCEFDSIAANPKGPEVWVQLSESIDRVATATPCDLLRQKLIQVAGDTIERHQEVIDCYGRPLQSGDVNNAHNMAYQSILDALVSLEALDDIDDLLKGALITQLAIVAAELRGEWMCLPS